MAKQTAKNGDDAAKTKDCAPPPSGPAPHPKLWQALVNLRAERTRAKVREVDLVKSRKELEESIKQRGQKKSAEGLDLCFRFFWLRQTIDEMRLTQRTLADKVDKVIDFASGGVLLAEAVVDDFLLRLEKGELDDDGADDGENEGDGGSLYDAPKPPPADPPVQYGGTLPDWKTPVGNVVRFEAAKKLSGLKLATLNEVHQYLTANGWRQDDDDASADALEALCGEAAIDDESAALLDGAIRAVLERVQAKPAAAAPPKDSKPGATKPADDGGAREIDYSIPLANIVKSEKAQDKLTEHGLHRLRDVKAYIGNASGEAGVQGLVDHIGLSEPEAAKVLQAMGEPVPETWAKPRGRGRPPKNKAAAEKPKSGGKGGAEAPARKRGRPPKARQTEVA